MDEKRINAIPLLAKASGLKESDIQDIWRKVKDNQQRIDNCAGHQFVEAPKFKKRCAVCGGEVDAREARLYEQGLTHGRAK